jgi:hypothetical protein
VPAALLELLVVIRNLVLAVQAQLPRWTMN